MAKRPHRPYVWVIEAVSSRGRWSSVDTHAYTNRFEAERFCREWRTDCPGDSFRVRLVGYCEVCGCAAPEGCEDTHEQWHRQRGEIR